MVGVVKNNKRRGDAPFGEEWKKHDLYFDKGVRGLGGISIGSDLWGENDCFLVVRKQKA